jgi:hypothetical protein
VREERSLSELSSIPWTFKLSSGVEVLASDDEVEGIITTVLLYG